MSPKNSRTKGFAPILILIIFAIVGIGGFVAYKQLPNFVKKGNTAEIAATGGSPTPSEGAPTGTTPGVSKGATPAPKPTTKPTPTSTPTPTPLKKNTCSVSVVYGKLNGDTSDPLLVTLVYSYTGYNNSYMTGAQWDFDGNGSWDTDLKQSNGTIEHTYSSGTYYPRLQLQGSDGQSTDVCTGKAAVDGMEVFLIGKMYNDSNCNHSVDSGESGKAGAQITIFDANGNVFKTVTTDGNGEYSFSKNIPTSSSLTLLASYNAHDNYSNYTPSAATVSASARTGIINIPFVSYDQFTSDASCH